MPDTQSLPTTIGEVARFYPPEPDSLVVQLRATVARLDRAASELRNLINERDERDKAAVDEIAGTAQAHGDLGALIARFTPADRGLLQYRAELVERARNLVHRRLNTAEFGGDLVHKRWRERCREVEQEWREATADVVIGGHPGTDADRLSRLVAFAERHAQTPR